MPDSRADTEAILAWLATLDPTTYVNVMGRYHPDGRVPRAPQRYPELNRTITRAEHEAALAAARAHGLRLEVRDPHPRLRRGFAIL